MPDVCECGRPIEPHPERHTGVFSESDRQALTDALCQGIREVRAGAQPSPVRCAAGAVRARHRPGRGRLAQTHPDRRPARAGRLHL